MKIGVNEKIKVFLFFISYSKQKEFKTVQIIFHVIEYNHDLNKIINTDAKVS
jgi:hypothetical protein